MKKAYVVPLIVCLAIGFALGFGYKTYFTSNIPEQTSLSEEGLFSKKQECAKYRKEIEDKIRKDYNFEDSSYRQTAELDRIFYSPTENSCLYIMEGYMQFLDRQGVGKLYKLFDALTSELIGSREGCSNSDLCVSTAEEAKHSFNLMLEEYK